MPFYPLESSGYIKPLFQSFNGLSVDNSSCEDCCEAAVWHCWKVETLFLDISISAIKRCHAMMIITAVIPQRHLWSPSALLELSFYWPVRAMCISLSCRQHISIMDFFNVFPPTPSDNVCSCVCVCHPSLGMEDLSAVDLIFCICCSFSVVLLILVHPFQTAEAQYFCQKPICPLSWLISSLLSSSSMSPFVSALLAACMFHFSIIEHLI